MNFDFTNYTFSGLLSILASLYGVGYPLVIQSIGRIYSQYDSALLSQRFIKESAYRVFQALLIINLLVAVFMPFLLLPDSYNKWLITVQAILLTWLIGQTFLLFRLMLIYSNAGKLLEHIAKKQIDKTNVLDIFDIAVYADLKHNIKLYIDAMSYVGVYIHAQQGDTIDIGYSKVLPPAIYDGTTQEIILKLKEYIRTDDGFHYLHRNNDIVSMLYNQTSASRLSLQAHQWMWMLLNEAITYNNHSWFSQYWQFADSYSSLKYHFAYDENLRNDKKEFMLRHVMIGTLLVHNERYRWLNDIFFYTHSEPEYYGLIPSSFAEIIHMMEQVDAVCKVPAFQHQNFYFADEMGGVKDEKFIFREAIRYLSLLVIRLWSLEGRSIMSKTELMAVPYSPILIDDDKRAELLMTWMKSDVDEWYRKGIFTKIPRLLAVKQSDVVALLDAYGTQCKSTREQHEQHPDVAPAKFDILKEQLVNSISDLSFTLPKQNSLSNKTGVNLSTQVGQSEILETLHFTNYMNFGNADMSLVMVPNFTFEIYRAYFGYLSNYVKRLATYVISDTQIDAFLDQIGMNYRYAIIASEKSDGLDNVSLYLDCKIWPKSFIIMMRDEIPVVEFEPCKGDALKPITPNSPFCSNIDDFLDCRDPKFECILATRMSIFHGHNIHGVVRVAIDNSVGEQPLNVTKTLDDLFS